MQQSVPLSSHTENGENDVTVIALELTEDGIRRGRANCLCIFPKMIYLRKAVLLDDFAIYIIPVSS